MERPNGTFSSLLPSTPNRNTDRGTYLVLVRHSCRSLLWCSFRNLTCETPSLLFLWSASRNEAYICYSPRSASPCPRPHVYFVHVWSLPGLTVRLSFPFALFVCRYYNCGRLDDTYCFVRVQAVKASGLNAAGKDEVKGEVEVVVVNHPSPASPTGVKWEKATCLNELVLNSSKSKDIDRFLQYGGGTE